MPDRAKIRDLAYAAAAFALALYVMYGKPTLPFSFGGLVDEFCDQDIVTLVECCVLSFLFSLWILQIGRVASALNSGFRVPAVSFWPLLLVPADGLFEMRWNIEPYLQAIPSDPRTGEPFVSYVGGSIALLSAGGLATCGVLSFGLPVRPVLFGFAACAVMFAIVCVRHAHLIHLEFRRHPESITALENLSAEEWSLLRPRDYSASLIETACSPDAIPGIRRQGLLLAYRRAQDLGDPGQAWRFLSEALPLPSMQNFSELAAEAAYMHATYLNDAVEAEKWLRKVTYLPEMYAYIGHRAEAAVHLAHDRLDEARASAERGLKIVLTRRQTGGRLAEADLLQNLVVLAQTRDIDFPK